MKAWNTPMSCRDDVDLDSDLDQELQGRLEEQKVQGGHPRVEMQSSRDASVQIRRGGTSWRGSLVGALLLWRSWWRRRHGGDVGVERRQKGPGTAAVDPRRR
jgi:hypothetical protein